MGKNKKKPVQEEKKVVTKYDLKMEKRRKEEQQEKINKHVARSVAILILLAIVGTVGYFSGTYFVKQYHAANDTYLTVGDNAISELEYDYFYNTASTNYINTNSYMLYYMGFDSSKPYDEQDYSEDMTWEEYFQQLAITQIQQEYALEADGNKEGFTHDSTAEYKEFYENAKTEAKSQNLSLSAYWRQLFGEYATKRNIRKFIDRSLYASAYSESLLESYKPSEDEAKAYYEDHKEDYDLLSYYSFTFNPANYSEDDDLAAMAEEMAEKAKKTDDFDSLCVKYAAEDQKESYESEDSEYSLTSDSTGSYADAAFRDWLMDESRKENDVTVIHDDSVNFYYVLKFVSRKYDDNCIDTITQKQAADQLNAYLDDLTAEGYEAVDVQGHISYLKKKKAQDDAATTTENVLKTDVIE